jgi:hypothetical protein
MKRIVRVLAACAIALTAQSPWASPSTLFWTPATNYGLVGLVKEDARGGAGELRGLLPPKDQEQRDADDDQEEGQLHARILDRGRAEPWPGGEPRNRAVSTSRPS